MFLLYIFIHTHPYKYICIYAIAGTNLTFLYKYVKSVFVYICKYVCMCID